MNRKVVVVEVAGGWAAKIVGVGSWIYLGPKRKIRANGLLPVATTKAKAIALAEVWCQENGDTMVTK